MRAAWIVGALLASLVSACGLKQGLERPPPIWGDKPAEEPASADQPQTQPAEPQ